MAGGEALQCCGEVVRVADRLAAGRLGHAAQRFRGVGGAVADHVDRVEERAGAAERLHHLAHVAVHLRVLVVSPAELHEEIGVEARAEDDDVLLPLHGRQARGHVAESGELALHVVAQHLPRELLVLFAAGDDLVDVIVAGAETDRQRHPLRASFDLRPPLPLLRGEADAERVLHVVGLERGDGAPHDDVVVEERHHEAHPAAVRQRGDGEVVGGRIRALHRRVGRLLRALDARGARERQIE